MTRLPKKRKRGEDKLPEIQEGDLFGLILRLLGGSWIDVFCSDGVIRRVRIPRSKRSIRVRENDIIIVRPWYGIDENRADMKDKLSPRDVKMLLQSQHGDALRKILTDELKEIYGIE